MERGVIRGIVPILPMPFAADEQADYEAIPALVDFAVACGAAAVGFPAFGSEFYKLDGGERERAIGEVIRSAAGRLPVIVQCNHGHGGVAAKMAGAAEKQGADFINVALPRAFAVSEEQLLEFGRTVCEATSLPVVLQDWNPMGEPVDAGFVARLHAACPNLRFVKYEDPATGRRARELRELTGGGVGVFSGWGGSHLIQAFPGGICGAMPGLSLCDRFVQIWKHCCAGDCRAALDAYSAIAAFVQFGLQTFEIFHHAEKRLLQARRVLASAVVRSPTVLPGPDQELYLQALIHQILS